MRWTTATSNCWFAKTLTKVALEYSGRLMERPLRMAATASGVAVTEGKLVRICRGWR
jgi:hypothetical protein